MRSAVPLLGATLLLGGALAVLAASRHGTAPASVDDPSGRPAESLQGAADLTGAEAELTGSSERRPHRATAPTLHGSSGPARHASASSAPAEPGVETAAYDVAKWGDPAPPPAYRGGRLEWHLRSNPPSSEISTYLAAFDQLPTRDQQGLLHYLHMHARADIGEALLAARSALPRTTSILGAYSRALSSTALQVARTAEGAKGRDAGETARALCLASLATCREIVEAQGRDTDAGTWAAIRRHIRDRWTVAVPGFLDLREAREHVEAIRSVLEAALDTACAPKGSYAGEDDAVALALVLGDGETIDALLRLAAHWEVARTRFGASHSRRDVAVLSMIDQSVRERGTVGHLIAWAAWLVDRVRLGSPESVELEVLRGAARHITADDRVPEDLRRNLRDAFRLGSRAEAAARGGGR